MTINKTFLSGLFIIFSYSQVVAGMSNPTNIEFDTPNELNNWVIVNDTVMGGRSRAGIDIKDGYLLFGGELSLENNGGFASTRRVYDSISWQGDRPLQIQVIGDGRAYQLRLRNNDRWDSYAYVATFQTKRGEITTHEFSLNDFIPLFRGRQVTGVPSLRFEDVQQIGIMLVDKTPGKFFVKIQYIRQSPDLI